MGVSVVYRRGEAGGLLQIILRTTLLAGRGSSLLSPSVVRDILPGTHEATADAVSGTAVSLPRSRRYLPALVTCQAWR